MVNGLNGNYTYTSGSLNSIFNDPFFIGFDRLTNRLSNAHSNANGFPPYNVRKLEDDDNFVIELAVAGYNRESINIEEHDGTLTIKGEKPEDQETYVHKGIAGRKFTRTFALGEYVNVTGAELKDGMLFVTLKREIPEDKKPKQIDIQ